MYVLRFGNGRFLGIGNKGFYCQKPLKNAVVFDRAKDADIRAGQLITESMLMYKKGSLEIVEINIDKQGNRYIK